MNSSTIILLPSLLICRGGGGGGRGPVEAGQRDSNSRAGKGDHTYGTIGQANELQLLVNQEARATTGCFRTTKLSGVRCHGACQLLGLDP